MSGWVLIIELVFTFAWRRVNVNQYVYGNVLRVLGTFFVFRIYIVQHKWVRSPHSPRFDPIRKAYEEFIFPYNSDKSVKLKVGTVLAY